MYDEIMIFCNSISLHAAALGKKCVWLNSKDIVKHKTFNRHQTFVYLLSYNRVTVLSLHAIQSPTLCSNTIQHVRVNLSTYMYMYIRVCTTEHVVFVYRQLHDIC